MFISEEYLKFYFRETSKNLKQSILSIFKSIVSVDEFLERILTLINVLKEEVNNLEKEQLFRFFEAFNQLKNLQKEYQYFPDLKTLAQFFRQLIISENLSFQGEPLRGLQLMGMLETRVLDFENLILISTNEGILPTNNQQSSFIPFDVKLAFDLPTYREKDAIFSYHFFRLLQRAKNVFIIYNTEHDVFGSGEKSRFVTQLEMMRKDVTQKIVSPKVLPQSLGKKEIFKDKTVLDALKELLSREFDLNCKNLQ